jgi:transcriptional regulator with XRE-family HTH domain
MEIESGNSTVPRRQLGRYLRQQRELAGKTVKASAEHLDCSPQKLWRIEKGAVPVRSPEVKILCEFYGTEARVAQALMGLAKETKARGWWQSYGDAVPEWFELYVGLEGAASRIRMFEPQLVPGLLQSHAYMESVTRVGRRQLTEDEFKQRIAIKRERQGLLSRHFPPPPRIEVILSEGVLFAAADVPGAMQQQLWHLLKAKELGRAGVRVLPLAAAPHRASISGAFTILEFASDAADRTALEPTTVYSESVTGALYLDKPHEILAYETVWNDLDARALAEGNSSELISKILREMNDSE